MKKISRLMKWPLGLLICLLATFLQAGTLSSIELLVRTQIKSPEIIFEPQIQTWLMTQPVINIGYWNSSLPPLHMGFQPDHFEGVTADYLNIIQQSTGLKFNFIRYSGHTAANQALASGELDMLALHDVSEGQRGEQTQTRAYLLNRKVIVRRIAETLKPSEDLKGQRLAFVGDENLAQQMRERYPQAQLIQYSNQLNALASLIYNQADALYSDSATADFLIRLLYANEAYVAGDALPTAADFNFLISGRKPQLLTAINQTLDAIPVDDMQRIATRWGLGINVVVDQPPLSLTPDETQWIATHRTIKVAVAGSYAPLTFYDSQDRLQGLSADLLKLISTRTGLPIDIHRDTTVGGMLAQLGSRQVNLVAALTIDGLPLNPEQYTRPYMVSPFVVITRRSDANIRSLDELDGKRLALPFGSPLSDWLTEYHPHIEQVTIASAVSGIEQLSDNDVDATVHTQLGADYFIKHHFQDDLRIALVIGPRPARMAMAVSEADMPLKSIINKILLEMPPEELKSLNDRWHNHTAPAVATSWSTYKDVVYNVIVAAVMFTLGFTIWNYYLRQQIRRRQKVERELGDQLEFSRTLIDEVPVALYVRNRHAQLIHCNQAYLDFLQTPREELIGTTLLQRSPVTPELDIEYHRIYLETIEHGQPTFADLDMKVKGEPFRIYHWTLPFRNSDNEVIGVIGGWLDITERQHLAEQLRLAKEIADEANHSKSVFLASMSHEIRTPLSALIGLIEMMRLRDGSAQQRDENLNVAHQSAQSLLSLIGDILDLSKIDAGAMMPSPRPTNLIALMQSTHTLFETNANKKNLAYSLDIEVHDAHVMIDAVMLNQIVGNLVSNAIKFTDNGSIQLRLKQLPRTQAQEPAHYCIDVIDSGIGLTRQQQQSIFEPFVQVPNANASTTRSGTGLGLSICTRLAALLGARLQVSSVTGAGSVFSLLFKAELSETRIETTSPDAATPSARSLRILVAEDHAPNRLLLCQQLDYLGHLPVPCDDGDTALALWQQAEPAFDLTITDCNMPRMNGYELTRQIRIKEQELGVRPHPILGLTANAQSQIIDDCLEAGMTYCLFKPLGVETLTEVLAEISQAVNRRLDAAGTNGGELQKLRVLCPDAYGPLVEELLRTHHEDGASLTQLLLHNDLPGLIRLAHKIKGGAQLANDQALLRACESLEAQASDGNSPGCLQPIEHILLRMAALEQRLLADL